MTAGQSSAGWRRGAAAAHTKMNSMPGGWGSDMNELAPGVFSYKPKPPTEEEEEEEEEPDQARAGPLCTMHRDYCIFIPGFGID